MPYIWCGRLVSEHWWDVVTEVSQRKFSDTRGVNGGASTSRRSLRMVEGHVTPELLTGWRWVQMDATG